MKTYYFLMFVLIFTYTPLRTDAQRFSVSGKVTDELTQMPVAQVNVVEVGSSIGTITNEDGSFFLMLNKGPVEIQFGGISHQPVKVSFELRQDTIIETRLGLSADERARRLKKEGLKSAPVSVASISSYREKQ